MNRIVEYNVIRASAINDLVATVQNFINAGWEPYGPPTLDDTAYLQAMVRRDIGRDKIG